MPPCKRPLANSASELLAGNGKRARSPDYSRCTTESEGSSFALLDLPFETRQLTYRFAFGYRTIHAHNLPDRALECDKKSSVRLSYLVGKCDTMANVSRSETAVGNIWAKEQEHSYLWSETEEKLNEEWRHAIPICGFKDYNHSGGVLGKLRNTKMIRREKLHLNLPRVNKQAFKSNSSLKFCVSINP
ncbi:uncharacterized protein BDV17DRAFT_296693 [Aspergillus undulatus]|uniref:uncharacterized protein n=1 Tax=Aspergillus undulatus TaxID=1810928 RepID=UPI003CCDCA8E